MYLTFSITLAIKDAKTCLQVTLEPRATLYLNAGQGQ